MFKIHDKVHTTSFKAPHKFFAMFEFFKRSYTVLRIHLTMPRMTLSRPRIVFTIFNSMPLKLLSRFATLPNDVCKLHSTFRSGFNSVQLLHPSSKPIICWTSAIIPLMGVVRSSVNLGKFYWSIYLYFVIWKNLNTFRFATSNKLFNYTYNFWENKKKVYLIWETVLK